MSAWFLCATVLRQSVKLKLLLLKSNNSESDGLAAVQTLWANIKIEIRCCRSVGDFWDKREYIWDQKVTVNSVNLHITAASLWGVAKDRCCLNKSVLGVCSFSLCINCLCTFAKHYYFFETLLISYYIWNKCSLSDLCFCYRSLPFSCPQWNIHV